MSRSNRARSHTSVPTLYEALIFRLKSVILQTVRFVKDKGDRNLKKNKRSNDLADALVIGESRTRLWTENSAAERYLVAGKINNLRRAIRDIDGLEVGGGDLFSFWQNIGRTSRRRGFVKGRELREGCLIPNIGGGLCQLSNALYDAALKANFEIVERHAHTQVVAGSLAEAGRDATVFWNYVDLRFRSANAFRIEAELSADHLTVGFRGRRPEKRSLYGLTRSGLNNGAVNSCASCGQTECFRSVKQPVDIGFGTTAFLVDEFIPEFDEYLITKRTAQDKIFLPIDGRRFRKQNYAWECGGFGEVRQHFGFTMRRSFQSRRLTSQGAARQRNMLAMSEQLAALYSERLSFDSLHLVVQQNLLPYLWRDGHLGGRTFDVLMTALPMTELQTRLDSAAKLHPQSSTLADFRADDELLNAENEALASARKLITTHTGIAALYPDKVELLQWRLPQTKNGQGVKNNKPTIIFPAATVGRKGCYELRDATRGLDVKLLTFGSYIEDAGFWNGFDVSVAGDDWLSHADLVVLPAFFEHRPRRLLQAAANGIPVIASKACGVENVRGIETMETCDVETLRQMIIRKLDAGL